jgi:arylsulfatase A-like enzyme
MSWEPLPQNVPTLSQTLTDAGIRTAAVVDTPFYTANGFGYDRGFRHFVELPTQPDSRRRTWSPQTRHSEHDYCAPKTFMAAEQALERLYEDRFFLMVDGWDPHEPWDPPAWYVRPYLPGYDGRVVGPPYGYYQDAGLTADDLTVARACYAGECTMVDRWIGRLLERLESLGVAEETAIVFTSDHGFHFGEHGGLFGKLVRSDVKVVRSPWARSPMYEDIAHIPLMIDVPGSPGRRVPQLASAVDLMPTVLDILGVQGPANWPMHGRSLVPAALGDTGTLHDTVVTAMPLHNPGADVAVVDDRLRRLRDWQPATISTTEWSMLYAARGELVELYHLPSDPGQERNVASGHSGLVQDLHRAYVDLLKATGTPEEIMSPRREL